jgi:type I restriction enzyme S subunit
MVSEWDELTIDELKSSMPNALATGPFGSAISSKFFVESGTPVIRGSNLSQEVGVRLIDEGLVFVDDDKKKEFARSVARKGDLIFTCWGTIDQVGLIDKRSRYEEYIVSNKQMKFTPDKEKADSLFLYYLLASPQMREKIVGEGIGSSVPGFNLGQLKAWRLRIPPLPEQHAIAKILGTLDDKIDLLRRMNDVLEAMAQALFKSWFVDFDPVLAKVEGRDTTLPRALADMFPSSFESSEFQDVPHGWRLVPLPDTIEVNPSRSLRRGEVAPYLDMANMPTRGHAPDLVIDRPFGSGMRFSNGDTLVARITPCLENGKTAFVDFLKPQQIGWGSTEYIVLRPKEPLPPEYAYFLARSVPFREFAIQSMTGSSGRQRVPAESLAHFKVIVPSDEIAAEFGRFASPLMARMSAAVKQSRILGALRDTLLPKLISGALRVGNVERIVGVQT